MKAFLICYDLNKSGQYYKNLLECIKGYDYVKVMQSTYVVLSNESATEIREKCKAQCDTNDFFFVTRFDDTDWCAYCSKTVVDWLNKNCRK